MQYAPTILLSVVSLALQYFPTLSLKRQDFHKNFLLNIKCDFVSTNSSKIFLILRRIERDIVINVRRCPCEILVIFMRYYA